jgi:energy-coupling factor transporter ATP-binding protein EcfA2
VLRIWEKVRQKVGILFQDPDDQLISATVFEDVAFGPRQFGVEGPSSRPWSAIAWVRSVSPDLSIVNRIV